MSGRVLGLTPARKFWRHADARSDIQLIIKLFKNLVLFAKTATGF